MNANRMPTIVFILLLSSMSAVSAQASEQVVGKTFYTTANLWFEKNESDMMNYHKGTILPVGTKIKVKEIFDGSAQFEHNALFNPVETGGVASQLRDYFIRFDDERGTSYKIKFLSQRTKGRSTAVWNFFKQYFSPDDPMAKEGAFNALTPDEQQHVMAGEIADGMSKAAVAMAYGYPPAHKTPSLQSDKWVYWETRFKTRVVSFSDDKVIDESADESGGGKGKEKVKSISPIENCIKACKENTSRSPEECFDACNH